jgi:hypothetical protein
MTDQELLQQVEYDQRCVVLHKELIELQMKHLQGVWECYDNLEKQIHATWLIVKVRLLKEGV